MPEGRPAAALGSDARDADRFAVATGLRPRIAEKDAGHIPGGDLLGQFREELGHLPPANSFPGQAPRQTSRQLHPGAVVPPQRVAVANYQ